MPRLKSNALLAHELIEVLDAEFLSAKELAQERQALAEERCKLGWLTESASAIARRVPTSVFAMGDLALIPASLRPS